MTDLPFQLTIKNASSGNREETLTCTALLRQVKGKRKIYDALWAGQNVIAKVFSDRFSAKRHLKKEWRGLKHLEQLQLNAPKALFYGEAEDGRQVVITEKIVNSKVAFDAFNEEAVSSVADPGAVHSVHGEHADAERGLYYPLTRIVMDAHPHWGVHLERVCLPAAVVKELQPCDHNVFVRIGIVRQEDAQGVLAQHLLAICQGHVTGSTYLLH